MVKKITFYDRTDAIQYQVEMRRLGYITKMIQRESKYEVIVAGEALDWKTRPAEEKTFSDASRDAGEPF